jgi:coatomer protein complex subunit alpha (xenin)
LVVVTLASVRAKYQRGIDATTRGEFAQALEAFRTCLQSVPLTLVTSAKEQKDLQELIHKLSEYITAMRIELERKRLTTSVRGL